MPEEIFGGYIYHDSKPVLQAKPIAPVWESYLMLCAAVIEFAARDCDITTDLPWKKSGSGDGEYWETHEPCREEVLEFVDGPAFELCVAGLEMSVETARRAFKQRISQPIVTHYM